MGIVQVMGVDVVWLNRVGITLNFLAGFLMAPDLIGREYLVRMEHRLKRALIRFRRAMRGPIKSFEVRHRIDHNDSPRYKRFIVGSGCWSMWVFFLFWLFWLDYLLQKVSSRAHVVGYVTATVFGVLVFGVVTRAVSLSSGKWQETSIGEAVTLMLFMVSEVALAILWGFLIGPVTLLLYGLPRFLARLTGIAMHRIRGNERFLKTLLLVGIVCFVMGNMLQLLATRR